MKPKYTIWYRIRTGESPKELGRRGGLKAAANRARRKANEQAAKEGWWNK